MAIELSYISEFLRTDGVEGKPQCRGYVPANPRNYTGQAHPEAYTAVMKSGVTIATGADLGTTNAETMLGYGLTPNIVEQLNPYFGINRDAAIQALFRHPIILLPQEASAIDDAVHAGYLALVVRRYNRDTPQNAFEDLPRQAQAVIFSMCYQMGCKGAPATGPNTWSALVRGDWTDAAYRLCSSHLWQHSQNRRRIEGQLLQDIPGVK